MVRVFICTIFPSAQNARRWSSDKTAVGRPSWITPEVQASYHPVPSVSLVNFAFTYLALDMRMTRMSSEQAQSPGR